MSLPPSRFALRRLRSRPLARLLWWDMLLVGTTINLAAGALALAAHLHGASLWLSGAIFLSPLPWNAVLAASAWRASAERPDHERLLVRLFAVVWLALMVLI